MHTKVGLFGIGLDTYWGQFDGLLENLKKYQLQIGTRITGFGVEVIDAGMVDNPVKAREVADYLKSQDVEIVFLYVSTYALSSTVLPIAQRLKIPVIILNLQPVAELDYAAFNSLNDRGKMTGIWLDAIVDDFHRAIQSSNRQLLKTALESLIAHIQTLDAEQDQKMESEEPVGVE